MTSPARPGDASRPFDATAITRPAPVLMTYYFLASLLAGPFFFIPLLPLFFKYETLRYRFDDSGISMKWGILFRKEIHLTYRRIQDIHLTRNLIQRWMGLATVGIQTASGSAGPEMSIEGILEAEALRDFLYSEMRGAKGLSKPAGKESGAEALANDGEADEALELLREIRDLLQERAGSGGTEA